jgi:hypothetical protein
MNKTRGSQKKKNMYAIVFYGRWGRMVLRVFYAAFLIVIYEVRYEVS